MADLFTSALDPEEVARTVDEVRRDVRYVVTDFTTELLVSKFRENPSDEGDIYVPDYQRSLAWSEMQSSYFVESLLLRVPVPPLFFYDVEGRLEIVDGSQRMRSIFDFVQNKFRLSELEKLDVLNGYYYSDLPSSIQRRLDNTPLRAFVLDQGVDESTRVEMFRRLNTSGKRLSDAEIRKGAYRGPFLDLVVECSDSGLFKDLTPRMARGVDARSERQELVTRFFVYADYYELFRHDVRKFLDGRMIHLNNTLEGQGLKRLKTEFERTMTYLRSYIPEAFYRSEGGTRVPRVRFEAIAVGAALALRINPKLSEPNKAWLKSKEFEALVRTEASNSAPKLRGRIEFVRDQLLASNDH